MAFGLERPRVMFFVRVVGVTKIVKQRDRLDDAFDGRAAEGSNSRRHHGHAAGQCVPQVIVQVADAFSLGFRGHDNIPVLRGQTCDARLVVCLGFEVGSGHAVETGWLPARGHTNKLGPSVGSSPSLPAQPYLPAQRYFVVEFNSATADTCRVNGLYFG